MQASNSSPDLSKPPTSAPVALPLTNAPVVPTTLLKPLPSPAPTTVIQAVSLPPTSTTNLPKFINPTHENIPLFQNTIPLQYVFQPYNFPQTQYLLQPQGLEQAFGQQQFLIPDQNIQQSPFIIPLYQTGLEGSASPPVNINLPDGQNPFSEAVKNINLEAVNTAIMAEKQINDVKNIEIKLNASKEIQDQKVSFIPQEKPNEILATQEGPTASPLIALSDHQQNFQYLVEIKPEASNNFPTNHHQNLVILSSNSQDKGIQVQNNAQVTETSTVRYIENEQENAQKAEIEYLTQAIQNELNLHHTEPLFGNNANEIRYTTSNEHATQNNEEQSSYDESVLNYENPGGYGSKIKAKKVNTDNKGNIDVSHRLIDRTRNLVTGVDVLNINDAITNYVTTGQGESASNLNNIVKEYTTGNVQYGYNENVPNTILEAVTNFNSNTPENKKESVLVGSSLIAGTVETQSDNNKNNLITSSSTYSTKANAIQNSRTKLLDILNSEKVVQHSQVNEHISLLQEPIIVADLDENNIVSTTEHYKSSTASISELLYSTTQNTIETKIASNNIGSTEIPILITPRPLSNNFLAPITAAVSLQNSQQDIEQLRKEIGEPETSVEIQKSVPYYLGKLEYISNEDGSTQEIHSSLDGESLSTKLFITKENSESGDSSFEQEKEENTNYAQAEPLIQTKTHNSLNDQQTEQGQVRQEYITINHQQISDDTKVVNKPIEITKYIDKPYPVEVPIGIPYAVEKQVPVEVEKIVEKPIHITQIVEKPVPIPVPQPYKVEVEKIIEKQVRVPVEVTKYIDNPYPVHIPYPQPIAIPVEVERLVQTVVKEPYPVPVEIKVPVPHPVHITKYIDKPYPVEKIVEKPYAVEKIVEKPVTKYIDKPYPVAVHVPIPHPVAIPVEIKVPHPYPVEITKYIDKPYGLPQGLAAPSTKIHLSYNNNHNAKHHQQLAQQSTQQSVAFPVTKLMQIPYELPKHFDRPYPLFSNYHQQKPNPYTYAPKYQIDWKTLLQNCHLNHNNNNKNPSHGDARFVKIPDYIGLVPPNKPILNHPVVNINQNYKRKARNSFGQNLRVEYGFKPPLIPSIQTDEFGMPLNNEE